MEPQLPTPQGSPEIGSPVTNPEVVIKGNEALVAAERLSQPEQKPVVVDSQIPAVPAIPIPQPLQTPIVAAPTVVPADQNSDNPAIAADDDLIEKAWVEKAKKVINDTKHDPYLQERAVSYLHADYLEKRYGKKIKLSDEA